MIDDIRNYINLNKTISEFGLPTSTKSRVVLTCDCGISWNARIDGVKRRLKSNGKIICRSCCLKNIFSDEKHRSELSKRSKQIWKDPVYAKKISDSTSKWQQNLDHKKKVSSTLKTVFSDKKLRANISHNLKKSWDEGIYSGISKSMCDKWKDPKYRENQINIKNSDDHKEKQSNLSKKLWSDPEYKMKMDHIMKSDEYKNKHKASLNTSEVKKRMALSRSLMSVNPSKIEIQAKGILEILNVMFSSQYPIGPYCFDLFVPSYNLLIECQGEYWHSSEKAKRRDASKFAFIKNNFPDHKILYLYERDFLNPEIIKHKLIRELFDDAFNVVPIDFNIESIKINKLSNIKSSDSRFYSCSELFLQTFHTAGIGKKEQFTYGAYLDDQLIGVCKFSKISQKLCGYNTSQFLELNRFCVNPLYDTCTFSNLFLKKCLYLGFCDSNVEYIVDVCEGVLNTIDGHITYSTNTEDYYYRSYDGFPVTKQVIKKHASSVRFTEDQYVKKHSYTKVLYKKRLYYLVDRLLIQYDDRRS